MNKKAGQRKAKRKPDKIKIKLDQSKMEELLMGVIKKGKHASERWRDGCTDTRSCRDATAQLKKKKLNTKEKKQKRWNGSEARRWRWFFLGDARRQSRRVFHW